MYKLPKTITHKFIIIIYKVLKTNNRDLHHTYNSTYIHQIDHIHDHSQFYKGITS